MTGGGSFYTVAPKKFFGEAILMIKKFFAAMMPAFALVIVVGGQSPVAADIYRHVVNNF